ncbi:relaxase/mobilization nuclease domain-containing protein [Alistipes sp. OttesenSCG-928-L06]|nr:relaxase/mobilization nuclease domain-containing protein [Alistipes sp. OttesenSCG-928-L06]
MVAKINHISSLYGALTYNIRKVDEHSARIISGNRMVSDLANNPENIMQQAMYSFENYLFANNKTRKPIVHISLNPRPEDSLTDAQFAALAGDYMEKLGYGDQPYLVFMHEDTGRRHIHIVSTCVDAQGVKIDHNFEWRRSMQACRELEEKYGLKQVADKKKELSEPYLKKADPKQGNLKRQVSNILKSALADYKFQTFGEYSALLSCFNIEAKIVKGEHNGEPYTGIVYTVVDDKGQAVSPPFKSSLFGKQFGHDGLTRKMQRHALNYKNKKWGPKIHDTVKLAMLSCGGKQKNFEKNLRSKGIDVVLRRNDEGRIYGVTFIDHNSREVYNGSRLGKEFSANIFEKLFNGPAEKDAPKQEQEHSHESLLEQIFGLFPSENPDDEMPDDEHNLPHKRRRKKKRSPGLS